ncbi:MAG TPA: hypothetical protein VNS32_00505 [Flavisolibacter sp.]|nr:hypothetical protein [Flavisolibacter sp.]
MPELVQYCDVIMGNLWAKEVMLGMSVPKDLPHEKKAFLQQALVVSEQIMKRYPKCKQVANTFRFDVNEGVKYYATLYSEGRLFVSNEHNTKTIIDKVGSGDTFMAGLIYGNYLKLNAQEIIDFSASAAFTKLFIKGDATTASVEEIRKGELNYV